MPFINRIGSGATRKFGFGAGMKPGAPTSVVGTAGNTQVSVAFTAPAVLGTGTISYTATSSPGSFTATGASSPLVVTGLSNGTAYTFTVTASNAFGSSTSAASASVTPRTVPNTPSAPTATRGDTQVSLSWTAPANNGSAITDYLIQHSTDSVNWTTFADGTSASTTATVTGLINGTSYVFRIAATNAVGTTAYSSASTPAVTPAGVPATPSAPTPTAGNASVSLSWTAPSANGSAITDYKVYYATSAGGTYTLFADGTSTGTTATVTGLTNGTAYYFKIAAVNAVGDSALSAASTASTPVAPPYFPPCFSSCTPSCGSPIFSYSVDAAGSCWVPSPAPGCGGLGRCFDRDYYTYASGTASCTDACGNVTTITCSSFDVDSTVASGCCGTC